MDSYRYHKRTQHLEKKIARLTDQHDRLRQTARSLTDLTTQGAKAVVNDALLHETAKSMLVEYHKFQERIVKSIANDNLHNDVCVPIRTHYQALDIELEGMLSRMCEDVNKMHLKVEDARDGIRIRGDPTAKCVKPPLISQNSLYCYYGGHEPEKIKRAMLQMTSLSAPLQLFVCSKHVEEHNDFISRIKSKKVEYVKQTGVYTYTIFHNSGQ